MSTHENNLSQFIDSVNPLQYSQLSSSHQPDDVSTHTDSSDTRHTDHHPPETTHTDSSDTKHTDHPPETTHTDSSDTKHTDNPPEITHTDSSGIKHTDTTEPPPPHTDVTP